MKLKIALLTAMALMITACGKQSKSGSTRVNRYSANQLITGTTTCNTATWGRIYDNNISDVSFRQKVADFSLKNLEEIGNISGNYNSQTGVEFQMTLNFVNGQLSQGSQAAFRISDSITIQENGGYIQFVMGGMSGSGANGQFNAQIGDQKGFVRLQGMKTTYQGQQVLYGQASYNNYNQGEVYLGEFVIAACAAVGI